MKKTIAAYKNGDDWIDQIDIEMHYLEESFISAHQELSAFRLSIPLMPSIEEEHEVLIEKGANQVKKNRLKVKKIIDDAQPKLKALHEKLEYFNKLWHSHAELCLANGLNPDTFEGNAADSLTLPIKEESCP